MTTTGKAPTLYHVRTMSKALDMQVESPACPSPPPFRPHVTVPFLWEDAPGKPKQLRATPPTAPSAASASPVLADGGATASADARPVLLKLPPRLQAAEYSLSFSPNTVLHGPYSGDATAAKVAGDHDDADAPARPALLKLPPRLQAAEYSLCSSPKTVLHGPYSGRVGGGGNNKPPRPLRRVASTASCVGGSLFVWRKGTATASASPSAGSKKVGYAVAPDASCSSPAASSASSSSSSSSSSMSYFFDEHSGRGAQWRQSDDSEDGEVGDDGGKGSVRITRFRRNRSLPTMSGSHLWANIRKGVKQISPWSQKPT